MGATGVSAWVAIPVTARATEMDNEIQALALIQVLRIIETGFN
jgi:hypothetical protein